MSESDPTDLPRLTPLSQVVRIQAPPVMQTVASPPRSPKKDEAGLLAEDIVCRTCGYNLRGLPPDGECPECNGSVARSIRGDELQFSDPAWVERLARGVKWIIIAVFVSIGSSIMMTVMNAMMAGARARGNALLANTAQIVAISIGVVQAAISVYGYWLVTSPDPASIDRERPICVRNVARYGMIIASLQSVAQALQHDNMQAMMTPAAKVSYSLAMAIGASAVLGFMLLGLIASAALFVLFGRLARRIPRQSLVWQTRVVMFGYLFSVLLMLTTQAILVIGGPGMFMPPGTGTPGFSTAFIVIAVTSCSGLLLMAAFGIWALVLLFMYLFAFRSAAAQARASLAMP